MAMLDESRELDYGSPEKAKLPSGRVVVARKLSPDRAKALMSRLVSVLGPECDRPFGMAELFGMFVWTVSEALVDPPMRISAGEDKDIKPGWMGPEDAAFLFSWACGAEPLEGEPARALHELLM
jgi:hypothetical protein